MTDFQNSNHELVGCSSSMIQPRSITIIGLNKKNYSEQQLSVIMFTVYRLQNYWYGKSPQCTEY